MRRAASLITSIVSLPFLASGCASCERRVESAPTTHVAPAPAAPPTYEVHEWGLLRGNLADHVVLSGPRRVPTPIPIAKPVLYFHREGEGLLSIDVEVTLASGTMVEHWPLVPSAGITSSTEASSRAHRRSRCRSRRSATIVSASPSSARSPVVSCACAARVRA